MNKTFIFVGIAIIAIVALFVWGSKGSQIDPPFQVGVLHPLDHIKGNADSSVVIMEYSDFQCPACRSYYPIVREIVAEFGDRVAFVYRHFPLITIHANAEFAARAAEAAGRQGKFWEMHDLLFEKQAEWSGVSDISTVFESYATLIGISVEQFRSDFSSKEIKDLVRAERVHALKSGLQGTPSFFINGKQIQNPNSAVEFKNLINASLSTDSL